MAPVEQGATMGQLILTAIARHADREAIADDSERWTYRRLGEEIGKTMAVLRAAGLGRGEGIAILAANRCALIAVEYAAMLMGLRYTALHPMAARETHDYIITDASVAALFVDPAILTWSLEGARERMPTVRLVFSFGALAGAVDLSRATADAQPHPLTDEARADDIVRLFYTGGTSGKPKGVMWPHRVMLAVTVSQGADWELPARPNFLAVTPVSHASGAIVPTILHRGGRVRLTRGFAADAFCAIVRAEAIDCTFLVPTMIYVLLDHLAAGGAGLETLDTLLYGAAPMSVDRLRQGLALIGPVFCQLYGQTEAPMCVTTLRKGDHDPANPALLCSCGYPTPLAGVALLDDRGDEVEPGRPGEICVRGPLVADGYWRRPEEDERAFAGGWLHTGDVAVRSPEGFLTIVDRNTDLIITGGFNVYPSEVEEVLNAEPDIALAAVVGAPDPKWGEAVMAFVVPRAGVSLDIDRLKARIREARGGVWVPKSFRIVSEIPLTAIGKVDRKALRGRLAEAAP